tara:strand:+ start:4572 stop:4730 length:159 start_codon:yes stop_codon:yes gene_type:complete
MNPFVEEIEELYVALANNNLTPDKKQKLLVYLEGMTKIDTPEKVQIFNELVS